MIRKFIFLLYFSLPLFCMAQNPSPREYSYDNAGNRTSRTVLPMQTPPLAPLPPAEPEYTALSH
ncbi:MAG: hypothetical protein FWC34_11460 [Bacteroidetes bacterium]|nr:hypothetical protein [Bacteroidota bacterium]MCL2302207.1 hypothetical protein [Lentimicrobiaceae bacterium]MCL2302287.1 hypothetical protein [Lentimicrobiaceae bacterium]